MRMRTISPCSLMNPQPLQRGLPLSSCSAACAEDSPASVHATLPLSLHHAPAATPSVGSSAGSCLRACALPIPSTSHFSVPTHLEVCLHLVFWLSAKMSPHERGFLCPSCLQHLLLTPPRNAYCISPLSFLPLTCHLPKSSHLLLHWLSHHLFLPLDFELREARGRPNSVSDIELAA